MTNGNSSLSPGQIKFFDNVVPSLEVGDYLLNFSQQFNPTTTPAIDESFSAYQVFSVQGPRYTLPSEDIFAAFPPDNGLGIFNQTLPHVVFSKRDLPWERNIFKDPDPAAQTPWMALLLFVEGQKLGGSSNPSLMDPAIANWSSNPTQVATLPASAFQGHDGKPDQDGILWPMLGAEWYESADFLSNTSTAFIDVDPTAFELLLPDKGKLPYLTHARQVDISHKDSSVLQKIGDGWYSVIVAGRLPDPPTATLPGRRNIVHLVSLEGFENFISASSVDLPAGTERVRLITFKGWTYTCLPDGGESFAQVVEGILKEPDGTHKTTSVVLPTSEFVQSSSADVYANQTVQEGYAPLRYQTRLGEQTFAWYRGPFSPLPVKNFISQFQGNPGNPEDWTSFGTASSALIYDKTYGLFNVSYAAAWETGRLLALSDAKFGQALLDWRRKGHLLVDIIMERKSQIAALKNFDPEHPDPATEKELIAAIEPYAFTDDFMKYLTDELADELAPEPPTDDPAPEPLAPFPAFPDMPTSPTNPQTIADLMKEPVVQKTIRQVGGEGLDDIANWLAERYLLVGVPFESLAPISEILPSESLRFFYLDSNWLDSLVEGALHIGVASSRDVFYQDLMKDLLWSTLQTALGTLRDNLLGDQAHKTPAGSTIPFDQESLAGMLLRSSLVANWPGLEFRAFTGYTDTNGEIRSDPATWMKALRIERLSEDVMLCLWPAIPAVVTIDEPREGIQFGFEDPPPAEGEGYYLYLRSLADDANFGMTLCTDVQIEEDQCSYQIDAVASGVIDADTRNIQVNTLISLIKDQLGQSSLPVRDFALQMIKVPEQAVFAATEIQEST